MDSPLPPLLQATAGAFGSAVGNAIVFPLDLATTRVQNAPSRSNSKKLNIIQTLHRLINRQGLSHLYSGLAADTASTLISSFLYFLFYTSLHKFLLRRHQLKLASQNGNQVTASPAGIGGMTTKASAGTSKHPEILGPLQELFIGVLSGVLSKGITLPISAVCVRQQLGSSPRSKSSSTEDADDNHSDSDDETSTKRRVKPLSLLQTLKALHAESGLLGLYSALPPSIPLSLLPSLTLYIHTILLRILPSKLQSHPPGALTFLLGAISSSLATMPLYPLILVKSLNQAGAFERLYGKGKKRGGRVTEGLGMVGMMERIVAVDGCSGLYKGVEGQLLKGLVQQGVMMLIKQRVEEAVVKVYKARARA